MGETASRGSAPTPALARKNRARFRRSPLGSQRQQPAHRAAPHRTAASASPPVHLPLRPQRIKQPQPSASRAASSRSGPVRREAANHASPRAVRVRYSTGHLEIRPETTTGRFSPAFAHSPAE